jgi:acetolactate synthase-1/2/3 large subunit
VLIDGDGSFLMHVQELEAIRRHNIRLLVIVMNDGAYGSEIHKLRAEGIDDSAAIFGRPPFEAIAQGFGLPGAKITELGQLKPAFEAYKSQPLAGVWNIYISDQVTTPNMRRTVQRGHGVM